VNGNLSYLLIVEYLVCLSSLELLITDLAKLSMLSDLGWIEIWPSEESLARE
jgi:hypothetical protein